MIAEMLAEAEAALEKAESELHDAKDQAERRRREVAGLRRALDAHRSNGFKKKAGEAAVAVLTSVADMPRWKGMARTQAIQEVLEAAGGKLHRKRIVQVLHQKGRMDDIRDVSAALAYLKRIKKVRSLGDGFWALSDSSAVEEVEERGS